MAAESVIGVVIDHHVRATLAGLQRCHGHKRLVSRAGRIGAAQRPVEQRLVEGVAQHFPAFGVNAIYKQIRIKRGLTDKSQYIARARVNGDQRPAPIAKHVFDQFLQLDVEREHHRVTRRRRVGRELAHGAATGRRFDLINTGGAVQLLFKTLLNAKFADVVRAAVVALVVAVVDGFFFLRVDPAYVADNVTAQLAQRIAAEQAGLDVDPRKAKTLRGKPGDFFIRQAGAYRQRLKVF